MNISKKEDKIGISLYILGLLLLGITSYIASIYWIMGKRDILSSIDDLSFSDMFTIISDVHPPLYYFIYKLCFKIASLFNFNNLKLIGRFVSILPFYLLFIIAATKIRKNFNWLTAGLFALTLISMPQMINYATELRMYSWSLFFVTTSFLVAYEIINNKNNTKNWIILTILTICSIYTHYYSAICSGLIYLFLLTCLIKNNKSEIKKSLFP